MLNSNPYSYNCFGHRKDVLRDFKKYTSKKLLSVIEATEKESRRIWMLELFAKAGEAKSRKKRYLFWCQDIQPKELITENFTKQKLDDIHNDPIETEKVEKAEEYLYCSAKDFLTNRMGLLHLKSLF